jgi:rubredoxin
MFKKYFCVLCGYIYDEEIGVPEDGIDPRTVWSDVPISWKCPECGVGKEDFFVIEI